MQTWRKDAISKQKIEDLQEAKPADTLILSTELPEINLLLFSYLVCGS